MVRKRGDVLISDEELLKIAEEHKDKITSVNKWNQYAKENKLPHSQTFILRFGSWNDLKAKLNLETNRQHRPFKYGVEELKSILKEHSKEYTSINHWNQYAIEHKLPTHSVFERHLGLLMLEELTPFRDRVSKENLKDVILMHFPDSPPTMTEWTMVAKDMGLPSTSTITRCFGKWKDMKEYIYRPK
ncbi:hypothetical protein [Bacillus cihuensis]|uniref:hypothetical protein n=1 Tax=Bacillus cihuensis TaxID=1208599 RepID=UPI0004187025|nr:hypothetical protein [Bacillus cihuensis]